ncbi:DUF4105 domain-containing protein [Gammaproteobacteria bacterium]|nr:DUF4105 domain-containing protein [Gammaproteobacteria bacterium]MDB4003313.1 DUF4105 domain-containing protein [Gammaproteobacteria bacterium]
MTYAVMREIRVKDASIGLSQLLSLSVRPRQSLVCVALLAVLAAQSLLAAENGAHEDPSQLSIYLITVDVGDNVWDNFGHSALRIVDGLAGTDTIYNWGVFEVRDGPVAFAYDFFLDELEYRLATQGTRREIDNYRAQRRSVWQDEIRLTAAQKQRLLARLNWNRAPENLYYDYDYFFNNCTTRIRDYLNEALDGAFYASVAAQAGSTFRDQVRSHYASLQPISFSLDVIMNGNLDREMTGWESLFLPLNLRASLASMQVVEPPMGGLQPLFGERETLLSYEAPAAQRDFYGVASFYGLCLCIYLLLMLKRIRRSYFATHSQIGFRFAGFNFRLLGALSFLLFGLSGIYGVLMLGSWFFSGHGDLHHNANLLMFWPTDLIGAVIALRWFFLAQPWSLTHNNKPFMVYYFFAKLCAVILYCGATFSGYFEQDTQQIALFITPCLFVVGLLSWIVGFEAAKRSDSIL